MILNYENFARDLEFRFRICNCLDFRAKGVESFWSNFCVKKHY